MGQYGEFGRWSLVGIKVCLTTTSPNTVHTFYSGQVGRIEVRIFWALRGKSTTALYKHGRAAFPLQFFFFHKIQVITHTHWSINASLQHPRPCRRAGIFGIHEWQVHCLGVELFLNQVQFFIKQLEYFHGFLVNGASDCLSWNKSIPSPTKGTAMKVFRRLSVSHLL